MAATSDIDTASRPRRRRRAGSATAAARADAFAVARRHSYLVRTLRVALPVAAIGTLVVYGSLVATRLALQARGLDVGQTTITARDLTMKNPSYTGVSKDGGRYEVKAQEAIVDLKQVEPAKLFKIDGILRQTNGVETRLVSTRGTYDNKTGELRLFESVDIDATNGLRARLKSAIVHTKEQRVLTGEPFTAETSTGQIAASAMDFWTKSKIGAFGGGVTVRLVPGAGDGAGGAMPAAIGLGRDTRQPVDVKSDRLEIDDTHKRAVFKTDVVATQGDSILQSAELTVLYEGNADVGALMSAPQASATPKAGTATDASRVSRLTAKTGVVLTTGADRRVTADVADFDVKADAALLTGQVHVTQGRNQLRGRRLTLDRKTGRSRLDSPAEPGLAAGRIAATFYQTEGRATAARAKPKQVEEASPFGTFRTDPTAPIDIDAATLDLNDVTKVSVFRGDVRAQQADFVVKSSELVATYSGSTGLSAAADQGGEKANAELTKVEARQNVVITSKDGQSAKGDNAVFDVKANTVLITGKQVVVTQGQNVVECARMLIDMNTGLSNCQPGAGATGAAASAVAIPLPPGVQAGQPGSTRMRAVFYPKQLKDAANAAREQGKGSETSAKKAPSGWEPATSGGFVQRAPQAAPN
jgi:lipopolysaccharide transport protein LptA